MGLLNLYRKHFKNPTIVCIHGFGRKQTHEFNTLRAAFPDYNFSTPELYDINNPEDNHWEDWLAKAEKAIDEQSDKGKDVILVGFSMGGVIATNFATKPNIKKLILLAPAFEYITLSNVVGLVTKIIGLKEKEKLEYEQYPELPPTFMNAFTTIVSECKEKASLVTTPTLMIHGTDDPTIATSTSKKYFKKIPATKKHLLYIEDVEHHILTDGYNGPLAIAAIRSFIEEKF